MAIVIKSIDLSITNPALAGLANRQYQNNFTNVPNTHMPDELKEGLKVVHYALTGAELDLSSNTLAVSAAEGQMQRLYVPKLYASLDGSHCYVRWGDEKIELKADASGKLVPTVAVKGYKVSTKFSLFNPSARGEDPALEVKVTPPKAEGETDQTVYVANFAIAPKDWKAYTPANFETVLETDYASFIDLLAAEGTKSSGTDIAGIVTDDKTIRATLFGKDMPQTYELEFAITGFKTVKTSFGLSYILQARPSTNVELLAVMPAVATAFGMWAPRAAKSQLGAVPAPIVTAESPATLVMPVGRPAYLRFVQSDTVAGALDLSFD